ILATAYHASGAISSPVWNSLIGDLVPDESRGRFFGYRNQQANIIMVLAVMSAGVILEVSHSEKIPLVGFTVIFIGAFLSRAMSARWLAVHYDPPYTVMAESQFSFFEFLRRMPRSNFAKFVLFCSLMNLSVSVAGPYFAPYILKEVKLDFLRYMMMNLAQLV